MLATAKPYQLVEENLRHAMEFYVRVSAAGQVKEFPGVEAISCGRDYPVFNSALLRSQVPSEDGLLAARLAFPASYFRNLGIGWSYWFCHDMLDAATLREIGPACSSRGMEQVLTAPGMLAEALLPPERKPAKLEIREVDDAPTRLAFSHLVSMIFDLPFQMTLTVYGHSGIWSDQYAGFIGYAADRPAAIAMMNYSGGCAGFYSVGTMPGFRRRGYAETLMRAAFERTRARWNSDVCVLQSSSAGRRLYEKMGFREVTRFSVFRSSASNVVHLPQGDNPNGNG
jgi:ribosomal protein S18 acetylase RimI-like enzyme